MAQNDFRQERADAKVSPWIRLDTLIAVSALLISSLTAGASWWQSRIIQEQMSAQVWPYISVSQNFNGSSISIAIANDGLGPAVLDSASLSVDGKRQHNFIEVMHALLGANLMSRKPNGEKMSLSLSGGSPGDVLRPGDSNSIFSLTSKHFAPLFLHASRRITIDLCYCAIIPDTCWHEDNAITVSRPQAVAACPEISDDFLHAAVIDELQGKF